MTNITVKPTTKVLTICIIGKPNAGKSTLLNRLIGQKISIVTPKVQTTRSIITGIISLNQTQLIFFDTPGIFPAKRKLEKAMVRCAWSSLHSADVILLLIDGCNKIDDLTIDIIKRINSTGKQVIFLLNKVDLNLRYIAENSQILSSQFVDQQATRDNHSTPTPIILPLSALNGKGVDSLLSLLKNQALPSPWLYEEDDITNIPARFLASEITREQLFLHLDQELPYNLTVENESWLVQPDGSVKIHQIIVVIRESYKMMILGKGGSKIKLISTKARLGIEDLLGCKVHLFLFIKVRPNWEDNPESYHYMGLKM
jgi:GTP-binding protein Era